MTEFLEQSGADNFVADNYPIQIWDTSATWHWVWERSDSGDDQGVTAHSIQNTWDYWIEADRGLRSEAEGAAQANPPRELWLGIQSSCELNWDSTGGIATGKSSWIAEPTPRMIKCQGYLGMTFAPKGFFYSYYGPAYPYAAIRGVGNFYWEPDPPHPTRWAYVNGATVSGLVSLCPDTSNKSDTLITSTLAIDTARNGGDAQFRQSLGKGWLRQTPKWDAAKEFNDYVHLWEPVYFDLRYGDSHCARDQAQVGMVTITETQTAVAPVVSDSSEMFVQIGVFQPSNYFMLVNRRCDVNGRRVIFGEVSGVQNNEYQLIRLDSTGTMSIIGTGWGTVEFQDTLSAATGRLYCLQTIQEYGNGGIIDVAITVRGDWFINDPITVTSTGSVTILPGSHLYFTDDGSIAAYGQMKFLGKYDTEGDSAITVLSMSSEADGLITLSGSPQDTLAFTKFKHLDKGLKVSKSGSNKVSLYNCEFAYNKNEGLYVSGGEVKATKCTFTNNAGDGGYFYNTKATLDSLTVSRNEKNGLYFYSVNSASTLKHSSLVINGQRSDSSPQGNVMFYNCSPTIMKNEVASGAEYGLYGANGSYPLLYGTSSADNTIGGNASHETYWNASYPYLNGGHNNFDVADDTIIYITNISFSTFYAQNNYWGGGAPNIGPSSYSYVGPGTFSYYPYDSDKSLALPGGSNGTGLKGGQAGFGGRISEADDEAQAALTEAIDAEIERPNVAMQNYRRIIERFGETSAAPIAVERLLWMVRNQFADDNQRNGELDRLSNFYRVLADTSHNPGLVWKARRAALWALAAQHRYEEAIRGFEAIVDRHDNLADSVFAVIDAGTLQLEAREWAARDSGAHVQSMFGSRQELAPVSFEAHRKHTDELLGLLGMADGARRSTVPTEYFLDQNYPNPFNAVTQIKYGLPEASDVKLRIYDLMGREVITLIQGQQKAGYYRMLWDGKNADGMQVTSGMYFVRLETPNFTKVNKMTLVK